MAHLQTYPQPVVARTMISTTLAKETTKPTVEAIPPAFRWYKKVFSDAEA
jgi:hypothetical protein